MTNRQNNKLEMLMSVNNFFTENNAVFIPFPHFPPLINALKDVVDNIFEQSGLSTENITGYTEQKNMYRSKLEMSCGKVGKALLAYFTNTGLTSPLEADDYLPSAVSSAADSDLYVAARQLHLHADPVKTLLAPYNCSAADVDALSAAAETFLPEIKVARNKRRERSRTVKKLAQLFRDADALLQNADNYLAVYQFTNQKLYTAYKLSRKIIDRASGHTVHKKQGRVLPGFVAYAAFAPGIVNEKTPLTLSNKSKAGDLHFYFSSRTSVRPAPGAPTLTVKNGKTLKATPAELGYNAQNTILNIWNPNVRHAQWKVEAGK